MNILFLIGPRGSGKSRIAKLLARKCLCPALDTDELLSANAGKSIAEIVKSEGWPAFRERERAALLRAVEILTEAATGGTYCGAPPSGIIATGGGIVLNPENRTFMLQMGTVVYLNAPLEVLLQRLRAEPTAQRPALTDMDLAEEMRAVLAERDPLYREMAHHVVDASLPPEAVMAAILPYFTKASAT